MDRRQFMQLSALGLVGLTADPFSVLSAQERGKRIAVVVGVSNYDHGYQLLDYAGKDAQRVALALTRLGYAMKVLASDADVGSVERDEVVKALKKAAASA